MNKNFRNIFLVSTLAFASSSAMADIAKSEKHATKATDLRQAVFTLLGTNMGPLGGMAKGKIPFDAKVVAKNAQRINQISLMVSDYTKVDTRGFKVKTAALDKVWTDRKAFEQKIKDLTNASAALMATVVSGDEKAMKKGIAGVGKTCGSCHDDFKAD